MKRWSYLVVFVATLVAFSFFESKKTEDSRILRITDLKKIPPLKILDVVLRAGVDMDSVVISKISHSPWTHVGVVISVSPIEIIHVSTSDANNQVTRTTLSSFLYNANRIAIKRYAIAVESRKKIVDFLNQQIGKRFTFDKKSPLYCTTLIESAFGADFLNLRYQNVRAPIVGGDYLMPRAFYEDSKSVLIYEIGKNSK